MPNTEIKTLSPEDAVSKLGDALIESERTIASKDAEITRLTSERDEARKVGIRWQKRDADDSAIFVGQTGEDAFVGQLRAGRVWGQDGKYPFWYGEFAFNPDPGQFYGTSSMYPCSPRFYTRNEAKLHVESAIRNWFDLAFTIVN
jgi:hypothetical protein